MSGDEQYSQLDQDLDAFGDKWSVENSIIWCQECQSSQAVDQAADAFVHRAGCLNETESAQHPWHELKACCEICPIFENKTGRQLRPLCRPDAGVEGI